MEQELSPQLVERVRETVSAHTRRTPMLRSDWLSAVAGGEVFLKCENLQATGSFKLRGALAAVSLLDQDARRYGVVASSAGNHGLGLARAAVIFGVDCTVIVPRDAPRIKVEGIRAEGGKVVVSPFPGYDETQAWAHEAYSEAAFISPFDDPVVMAGNGGTTFLEMIEEVPDLQTILTPCGGGGMANDMGIVARSQGVAITGVNTDASPGMWMSRRDGHAYLEVDSAPTIAEGIEGGVSQRTYELGKTLIDDVVVVSESTIRRAVVEIAARERLVVEGSGAAGVAAVLEGHARGRCVGIVLTGSNIDPERMASLIAGDRGVSR